MVRYKLSCYGIKKQQRLGFEEALDRLCKHLEASGCSITHNERRGSRRSYYEVVIYLANYIDYNAFILVTKAKFMYSLDCKDLEVYLNLYKMFKDSLYISKRYLDLTTKHVQYHEKRNI